MQSVREERYKIYFCGVGTQFQNGKAENIIRYLQDQTHK